MSAASNHSTVQCLSAVAQHHGIAALPERPVHEFVLDASEPSTRLLLRMADALGLKAQARNLDWAALTALDGVFPLIARHADGRSVIVAGVVRGEAGSPALLAVLDPRAADGVVHTGEQAFCAGWSGETVLLKRRFRLLDADQPFGLGWFVPEIIRQRGAFRDVAVAAVMLHLLGLATAVYTQLVIDKVLAHESLSTLAVLTVAVVGLLLFEAGFTYLRSHLMLHATNIIDMRLAKRTFAQLLALPIEYFESGTAGVIVRHMQQVHTIRNFLTGQLFFTALDATALLVFVPLLFSYSIKLGLVVLGFSALMAAVVLLMIKPFNRRLEALYNAEGVRQSMLVETIHGIRTVKALAIEPSLRRVWDQRSAEAITMHFRVGRVSQTGNAITDFLGKLLPVVIIVIGAQHVFDQTLSVGALIAFQMISGRVSQPLIAMVGLVNEYQETVLSVRMLGEVMNRQPEGRSGAGGLRPQLEGEIRFEQVSFRYPGATNMALNRATFTIPSGAVVGIVGRSGSGKTTLTKLIQGLYPLQEGVVRFDGVDAREIELSHLRRQIGVVLQENFLFRGTVRENLMIAKPDASFEEIVAAAQAAGADEFIERMAQGYDTMLEENASNLSGGQKQRLSIARSLLTRPRILVLDEAASALDPESESIFINNLSKIAVGRTVIMISHRLSTLVNAHTILVMQNGQLMDSGRHGELLTRCETYQTLWNQQTSHI